MIPFESHAYLLDATGSGLFGVRSPQLTVAQTVVANGWERGTPRPTNQLFEIDSEFPATKRACDRVPTRRTSFW